MLDLIIEAFPSPSPISSSSSIKSIYLQWCFSCRSPFYLTIRSSHKLCQDQGIHIYLFFYLYLGLHLSSLICNTYISISYRCNWQYVGAHLFSFSIYISISMCTSLFCISICIKIPMALHIIIHIDIHINQSIYVHVSISIYIEYQLNRHLTKLLLRKESIALFIG